jgi:hypothetical protein
VKSKKGARMGTTLEQVSQFLDSQELRHKVLEERILTGFGTQQYLDEDGDYHLKMVVSLEEEGEFFKVYSPGCYRYDGEEHRLAILQTLLMVSWRSKMVQFEYDASDGEIRAVIEYPLEDSSLTERQLMRSVIALVQIIDHYHPVIALAISEGSIDFSLVEGDDDELLEIFKEVSEKITETVEETKVEAPKEEEDKEAEEEKESDSDFDDDFI